MTHLRSLGATSTSQAPLWLSAARATALAAGCILHVRFPWHGTALAASGRFQPSLPLRPVPRGPDETLPSCGMLPGC